MLQISPNWPKSATVTHVMPFVISSPNDQNKPIYRLTHFGLQSTYFWCFWLLVKWPRGVPIILTVETKVISKIGIPILHFLSSWDKTIWIKSMLVPLRVSHWVLLVRQIQGEKLGWWDINTGVGSWDFGWFLFVFGCFLLGRDMWFCGFC